MAVGLQQALEMLPQPCSLLRVLRTQSGDKRHSSYANQMLFKLHSIKNKHTQKVLLFSEEVTAECDHAKQDLNHLLHHIYLPLQIILPLLTISIHSNVDTLIKLRIK